MKRYKNLFIPLIFSFIFCVSCKEREETCYCNIINDSDYRIFQIGGYDSIPVDCFTVEGLLQENGYSTYPKGIYPKSTGCSNYIANILSRNSSITVYLYIYDYYEIRDMSCKEFYEKKPVKKIYALTQADAESLGWAITFPPTEAMKDIKQWPPYGKD